MAKYLFIFECSDMDRSVEESSSSYSATKVFSDSALYSAANLRSRLTEEKIEEFPINIRYRLVLVVYLLFCALIGSIILSEVAESLGGIATGIFESAFKCGFRVPMLPILKKSSGKCE